MPRILEEQHLTTRARAVLIVLVLAAALVALVVYLGVDTWRDRSNPTAPAPPPAALPATPPVAQ